MTRFRPCIDLHHGKVKQIVGGSLTGNPEELKTNFIAEHGAGWYSRLYQKDRLPGGHIIKLGPGNDDAAKEALAAWPGGMQIGGGITPGNAAEWLDAGASHVIATSCLFDRDGHFLEEQLKELSRVTGPGRLVIDLSCRKTASGWTVAMNRWQTLTDLHITPAALDNLARHCDQFLIHAADVEGLCSGIDRELVALLGSWKKRPITYAGGISSIGDFDLIGQLSGGSVDATVGSALDIFGGSLVNYSALVARERQLDHETLPQNNP